METVSNVASAASRAIWGDTTKKDTVQNETAGQEPLSGELGNVKIGEPYDKGNDEPPPRSEPKSLTKTSSKEIPSADSTVDIPATASTSDHSAAAQDVPSKQQGADKPIEAPPSLESERIQETKKEAEAAAVDIAGPGPVILDQKSKIGDATTGGADDGPPKQSAAEGTGEKYVKSSDAKVEGGDVDAAKPGAGKEADRLPEEKGVHREAPAQASPTSASPDSKDHKMSLKEKIKAKLHKH